MRDLFGNDVPEPDNYAVYLASARWAAKRAAKLAAAGYKCQHCGLSRHTVALDVHHLTYDRLGAERMEDLEVLCKDCHEGADLVREQNEREAKSRAALAQGFTNWLEKGGKHLDRLSDAYAVALKKEFLHFLRNKSGIAYSLDLSLLGKEDPIPNWKPGDDQGFTATIEYS